MPIHSRKIESGTKTIVIEYDGESASVTFVPGRYDLGRNFEIVAAQASGDWRQMGPHVVNVLADLIEEWDLVGPDGNPEPITPENLATIDPQLLLVIWGRIRAEGNQPRTNVEISNDGSSSPRPESALGGIESSRPRPIWGSPPGTSIVETDAPSGESVA